jgi:oligosaccharide repeat unit polymerase
MNIALLLTLALILIIRVILLYAYRNSGNIGYFIPFLLECVFVYPYFFVDFLNLNWSFTGLFTLYLMVLSIQIGFLSNIYESSSRLYFSFPRYTNFYIGLLLSLVFVLIVINQKGNFSALLNFERVFEIANQNAVDRYSNNISQGFLNRISAILSFILAFLFGVILAAKNNFKTKLLFYIYVLILFFDSIINAARAGMLLQLAAVASSYLTASYISNKNDLFNIKFSKLIKTIFFTFIVFAFFLIVQVFRGGNENFEVLIIASHVLTWFIGYIPAFDYWISQEYIFQHSYGTKTFAGIADLLNIEVRQGGVYNPVDIGQGRVSNVYTAFRGLIEDFSIFLVPFLLLFTSLLITKLISLTLKRKCIYSFIFINSIIYFFLWSFVINPFIYNSIVFAYVVYAILLILFVKLKKQG